jgi:hypothetical protein
MMIIEVIGIKSLKFGLSTTMSPGNLNKGIFERYGQRKPIKTIRTPIRIIIF